MAGIKLTRLRPWRRVRAGGGVVWRRRAGDGPVEVLLVHRPRYNDWSLPKGKIDARDRDERATALREVEEETGLRCDIGRELRTSRYFDAKGRHKTVRYWAMTPVGGTFVPNKEVDEIRWVTPDDASPLMSYERDRRVLASFRPPEGHG